jgi:abhydrolase domain-containing protein 12
MELLSDSRDGQKRTKLFITTPAFISDTFYRYWQLLGSSFLFSIKITSLSLFMIYVVIPIFVKANQSILPIFVFSNLLRWPPFMNLSSPVDFALNNTRNFYLHVEDGVDIGVWHIRPSDLAAEQSNIPWENFEDGLNNGNVIFLYLHGNGGTRGAHHRVQLYKVLSKLSFHVVTIDYRGYGDSSGVPTEDGVVADAYFTYKWLRKRSGNSKIFIWGHSLGTGITTKLAKKLCDEGDHPSGIVLEAPFNNIQEAAKHYPLLFPYRMLPWFEWVFVDGIREHGLYFSSDENILSVTPHIMILHAEDDYVVPFDLGKKLYHRARDTRSHKTGTVELVTFGAHLGFGHKLIYKAPELPVIIRKFVAQSD